MIQMNLNLHKSSNCYESLTNYDFDKDETGAAKKKFFFGLTDFRGVSQMGGHEPSWLATTPW